MLQNLYFSPIKNYKTFCTEVSEHTEKNRVRRKILFLFSHLILLRVLCAFAPLCEKRFLVAAVEKTFIE